jgi:P pilus assembly chaperone PapD
MASHRSRRIATVFLALGGIALAGLVSAAQFGLSMTRIHLDASHPVETLAVTNRDADATSFEVHVLRWRQADDGQWQLVPDDGLVVHPLIVTMQPGETARLRVGSLSPSVTEEQAYRIELAELPDKSKQMAGMVRMLARISLPVFVQPKDAKAALGVTVDALQAHDAKLMLHNTGTAYSAPQDGKLRIVDAAGKTLQDIAVNAPYVLAGAQAPMDAKLSGSTCTHAAKIELTLGKDAPIAVPVAPGARKCAP